MSSVIENGDFSQEEDLLLTKLVALYGTKNWKIITEHMVCLFPEIKRSHKDIKQRWTDAHLKRITDSKWSVVEEFILFEARKILGNKWSHISKFLHGRTERNVKNHFHSTMRSNLSIFKKAAAKSDCIKDNLRLLFTANYLKDKFEELKKYYDERRNVVNIHFSKDAGTFDDDYIISLIKSEKGNSHIIDEYIENLKAHITKENKSSSIEELLKNSLIVICLQNMDRSDICDILELNVPIQSHKNSSEEHKREEKKSNKAKGNKRKYVYAVEVISEENLSCLINQFYEVVKEKLDEYTLKTNVEEDYNEVSKIKKYLGNSVKPFKYANYNDLFNTIVEREISDLDPNLTSENILLKPNKVQSILKNYIKLRDDHDSEEQKFLGQKQVREIFDNYVD